jgi:pimeloyl-ACP methyl ester carboxylesterase
MSSDLDLLVAGGRRVRVRSTGPDDAPTILYLHGTPDSRLTIDICAALPVSVPVRLVAFDRPGYGGSDFAPFSLASVAEDAGKVLDAVGAGRVAVLGLSGGGPFALAIAAALGDRVTGAGVASGAASIAALPDAISELDESDRVAMALIGVDDHAAATAFAVGFAPLLEIMSADDDTMLAAMSDMMPADEDVRAIPAVRQGLPRTMREGVRQGADGCAWDNVAWVGEWRTDLSAVTQPTWLWYGSADTMAPVSHGEWLRDRLPNAQLVVHPSEGHLGIYPHWDEIATTLTATSR